jgi:hypothetical protein
VLFIFFMPLSWFLAHPGRAILFQTSLLTGLSLSTKHNPKRTPFKTLPTTSDEPVHHDLRCYTDHVQVFRSV